MFRNSRQRLWEGMSLFRLAEADIAAQRPAAAATNAETALTVLRGIGGEWRRGNVLVVLGQALNAIGHSGRAQVCWRESLDIFQTLGAPEAATVRRSSIRWPSPKGCPGLHRRSHAGAFIVRLSRPGSLCVVDPSRRGADGTT